MAMSGGTGFDRQAVLRDVQRQADTPVGYIVCPVQSCGGRIPMFADKRTVGCNVCGEQVIVA